VGNLGDGDGDGKTESEKVWEFPLFFYCEFFKGKGGPCIGKEWSY
jgi:hypothetical protein